MSVVIEVDNLGKRYRLGSIGGRRLVDDVSRWWAKVRGRPDPLAKIGSGENGSSGADSTNGYVWALRDVGFEVREGEALGIIGRNGAGKSTLLKVLSRITAPTRGEVRVAGRIASLLEVGTGFHPDLTGRENIFLNGAILGMTAREIRESFSEIVEFAELERFIDTPVKRYSSGMYVRLAFAVAAHLRPEILIVDEVLAVGDAAFQQRCLGKMKDVAGSGRTILFVSHNMAAITRLCERVLWIEKGRLRESGPAEEIVGRYLAAGNEDAGEVLYGNNGTPAPGSEYVRLEAIRIRNSDGVVTASLDIREPFLLEVQYRVLRPCSHLRIGIAITAQDGTVILSSKDMDGKEHLDRSPGVYVSRCRFPGEFLNFGHYYLSAGSDFPMVQSHFLVEQALGFRIEQTGGAGGHINDGRRGMLRLPLPWEIESLK